ncbi:hypothetical protein [Burkholderia pseudomallei]|uniref:hypothetical protein n=1 Tax=Burkholderia pseudomallei TaxID=28450 RepID=UPI00193CE0D4|nr:hypothetical protein [Burkholderia pseudomallei]QRM25817.1 hypothetical protein JQX71_32330 [Burkholderia pseudomallei]
MNHVWGLFAHRLAGRIRDCVLLPRKTRLKPLSTEHVLRGRRFRGLRFIGTSGWSWNRLARELEDADRTAAVGALTVLHVMLPGWRSRGSVSSGGCARACDPQQAGRQRRVWRDVFRLSPHVVVFSWSGCRLNR